MCTCPLAGICAALVFVAALQNLYLELAILVGVAKSTWAPKWGFCHLSHTLGGELSTNSKTLLYLISPHPFQCAHELTLRRAPITLRVCLITLSLLAQKSNPNELVFNSAEWERTEILKVIPTLGANYHMCDPWEGLVLFTRALQPPPNVL